MKNLLIVSDCTRIQCERAWIRLDEQIDGPLSHSDCNTGCDVTFISSFNRCGNHKCICIVPPNRRPREKWSTFRFRKMLNRAVNIQIEDSRSSLCKTTWFRCIDRSPYCIKYGVKHCKTSFTLLIARNSLKFSNHFLLKIILSHLPFFSIKITPKTKCTCPVFLGSKV